MKIKPFKLERFFAKYEFNTRYVLCSSDCESVKVGELFEMEQDSENQFNDLWLGYTESQGHPLLREQIAKLYTNVNPDHIIVHTGAEEAIFNTMNVLLNKGDHIIVHSPCYQSLMEVAYSIGCEVTLWKAAEDLNWALDFDFFKENIRSNTKLVIINCPHNPTGYIMPHHEYNELVNLSQKHGFILFSDEVYRFLEYTEVDRLPAMCEVNDTGLSLGVMSKAYGLAGLRIGWIATRNKNLYDKLLSFKDYTTICNSAPSEFLSIIALKNKNKLLDRNLSIIKENLVTLNKFFQRNSDRFSWNPPKAGPIAFPLLKNEDIDHFCHDLMVQAEVLLLPGTVYGNSYSNFRIGFGKKNLKQGIQKLDEYLQTK